jgi:hypothetical protein
MTPKKPSQSAKRAAWLASLKAGGDHELQMGHHRGSSPYQSDMETRINHDSGR